MFAMARHLGEHPTLVGSLVGFSMAAMAIGPLEEMLEQPGCPNLYWALTKLPVPLVSMEKGAEGERVWAAVEFRDLDESAPIARTRSSGSSRTSKSFLATANRVSQTRASAMQWRNESRPTGDSSGSTPADRFRIHGGAAASLPARPDHPARREA